jgi:hypothetical protein
MIWIWNCAGPVQQFREPQDASRYLVVGSLVVDLLEYRGITDTYRGGIEVSIAGRHVENGQVVHKNYWTMTDDRGYFFLANVPPGDYALRGFRLKVVGGDFFLNVVNPLRTEKDPYRVVKLGPLPDGAFVFPFPAQKNIVNLRHNYFILDRGKEVHHRVYFRLENFKTISGRILNEPDVISYFRSLHPSSLWFQRNAP